MFENVTLHVGHIESDPRFTAEEGRAHLRAEFHLLVHRAFTRSDGQRALETTRIPVSAFADLAQRLNDITTRRSLANVMCLVKGRLHSNRLGQLSVTATTILPFACLAEVPAHLAAARPA